MGTRSKSMVDIINFVFTWLQEWSEVVAGVGSIVLTAGLVYLYSRQTSIQEEQQDLLRRDLNREVRMGHTQIRGGSNALTLLLVRLIGVKATF
jgi:hypothetical protein